MLIRLVRRARRERINKVCHDLRAVFIADRRNRRWTGLLNDVRRPRRTDSRWLIHVRDVKHKRMSRFGRLQVLASGGAIAAVLNLKAKAAKARSVLIRRGPKDKLIAENGEHAHEIAGLHRIAIHQQRPRRRIGQRRNPDGNEAIRRVIEHVRKSEIEDT